MSEFDPNGMDEEIRAYMGKQAAVKQQEEHFIRPDADLVAVGEELSRQEEEAIRAITRDEYTREQLFELHTELTMKARELMRKKNSDYSTVGPFQNLKASEAFGVSAELGTLVRLGDKLSRISSLLSREAEVSGESFEDTIVDGINYLVLIAALRRSKEQSK